MSKLIPVTFQRTVGNAASRVGLTMLAVGLCVVQGLVTLEPALISLQHEMPVRGLHPRAGTQ